MKTLKSLAAQFSSKESNAFIQFVKYGMCGGVATAVHVFIFFLLAATIVPALTEDDFIVKFFGVAPARIGDKLRARNFIINNVAGFMVSNLTAYILNILWVFKRGKYHWVIELLMFYVVSGTSIFAGTVAGTILIRCFSLTTFFAFAVNMITSVMINYVLRKYFIFHG